MSRIRMSIPVLLAVVVSAALLYKYEWRSNAGTHPGVSPPYTSPLSIALIPNPHTIAEKIVNGAKTEAINKVVYNASYVSISYPNGDVPANQGSCTEVVIRALRKAGYNLQKLVHEDMSRNFHLYPHKWGLKKTDSNIDHRRVRNLMVYLHRHGKELTIRTSGDNVKTWKPGDIVCWDLNGKGLTHIGIVSNTTGSDKLPMIIHNIGPVAAEEEGLTSWKIIGHYRFPRA